MTKEQLKDYCLAEFENIEKVLSELNQVIKPGKIEYANFELAAICAYVHNFYNGIENLIKRVAAFQKVSIKETPTWHKDLLNSAMEIGLIDPDLHEVLSDYLSFRHYFVHSYCFSIEWEKLKPLVEKLENTCQAVRGSIFSYIERI